MTEEDTIEGLRTVLRMLRKRIDELNHERVLQGEIIGMLKDALRRIAKSERGSRNRNIAKDVLDKV